VFPDELELNNVGLIHLNLWIVVLIFSPGLFLSEAAEYIPFLS